MLRINRRKLFFVISPGSKMGSRSWFKNVTWTLLQGDKDGNQLLAWSFRSFYFSLIFENNFFETEVVDFFFFFFYKLCCKFVKNFSWQSPRWLFCWKIKTSRFLRDVFVLATTPTGAHICITALFVDIWWNSVGGCERRCIIQVNLLHIAFTWGHISNANMLWFKRMLQFLMVLRKNGKK